VPYKPTGLKVTPASATRADLTWTDNATNESGFQVWRRAGACAAKGWALIDTVPPDATAYSNTGLTTGTTYSYKVRAFTQSVNPPYANGYSSYSACVPVTTP
jgi:hypothetical protein